MKHACAGRRTNLHTRDMLHPLRGCPEWIFPPASLPGPASRGASFFARRVRRPRLERYLGFLAVAWLLWAGVAPDDGVLLAAASLPRISAHGSLFRGLSGTFSIIAL